MYEVITLKYQYKERLKEKRWKNVSQANSNPKTAGTPSNAGLDDQILARNVRITINTEDPTY